MGVKGFQIGFIRICVFGGNQPLSTLSLLPPHNVLEDLCETRRPSLATLCVKRQGLFTQQNPRCPWRYLGGLSTVSFFVFIVIKKSENMYKWGKLCQCFMNFMELFYQIT